jgi:large subunit ribosomal protein L24
MKIKKNDTVKVISGNKAIRGLVGKVVSVNQETQRVILENGAMHKKHLKPEKSRANPEGGIINIPASIHVSNVMLYSEELKRPVRVGFEVADSKKVRVARGNKISGTKI